MGASLVLPVTRVMRRGADVGRRAVSSAFGVSFSTSSARPIDEDSNSNEVEDYIWMEADQTLQCPCRFTQNFFVKRLGRHVEFDGTRDGFQTKYHDLLLPFSETKKQDIHAELERELCRRRNHHADALARKAFIKKNYTPRHADIYTLTEEHLDARFRELTKVCVEALQMQRETTTTKTPMDNTDRLHRGKKEKSSSPKEFVLQKCPGLIRERPAGVFSFPVFASDFCEKLLEEGKHFERSGMPIGRPNTMNDNGLLLFDLGFYETFLDVLLAKHVAPVSKALYGDLDPYEVCDDDSEIGSKSKRRNYKNAPGASSLDHHRSFLVRYEPGTSCGPKDVDLAYHWDDSEITLNVNLGGAFEGGDLLFGGLSTDTATNAHTSLNPVFHKPTVGVLHRGSQCHAASATESGRRVNLIIWGRSSVARRRRCAVCLAEKKKE